MCPVIKAHSTDPTVIVATHSTGHVHTAFILFDWALTLGTLVSSYLKSPVFVHLLLNLLARLPFMPGNLAFVTEVLMTSYAIHHLLTFD